MIFSSYEFVLLFLPIALLGFWTVSRWGGGRAALWWMVLASLFFYGWWNPIYLPLLLGLMTINYGVGMAIERAQVGRRALLVTGIAINLGALSYFKYANFFLGTIDQLAGTSWNPAPILLPLAISFFTFQKIAYLVDVYRGEVRNQGFVQYAFFVTFFPQLIAGPIVHYKEMVPQLLAKPRFSPQATNIAIGLTIFTVGLFKKVVLADGIAYYANPIFREAGAGHDVDFFLAWAGGIAYSLQLYFDFSGYSDMATGLARLVGLKLPINFDSPYKSKSMAELWRRWHITLMRFMRAYLYFPLGGNRGSPSRQYFNVFIVMFLCGAWHGSGWTFLLFGIYHGLVMVVYRMWTQLRQAAGLTREYAWWDNGLARALTLMAWVFGLTLFRSPDLATFGQMASGMAGLNGANLPLHWQGALAPLASLFSTLHIGFENAPVMLNSQIVLWMAGLAAITFFTPNIYQLLSRFDPVLLEEPLAPTRWPLWRPGWLLALAVSLMALTALLNMSNVSEFLYFQF